MDFDNIAKHDKQIQILKEQGFTGHIEIHFLKGQVLMVKKQSIIKAI
jgi:hypothetical protein